MQRYGVMRADELADCEALLTEFPTLVIAYIEEVTSKLWPRQHDIAPIHAPLLCINASPYLS